MKDSVCWKKKKRTFKRWLTSCLPAVKAHLHQGDISASLSWEASCNMWICMCLRFLSFPRVSDFPINKYSVYDCLCYISMPAACLSVKDTAMMRRASKYRKDFHLLLYVSCKQMTSSALCFLWLKHRATGSCLYLSLCVLYLPLLAGTHTCKLHLVLSFTGYKCSHLLPWHHSGKSMAELRTTLYIQIYQCELTNTQPHTCVTLEHEYYSEELCLWKEDKGGWKIHSLKKCFTCPINNTFFLYIYKLLTLQLVRTLGADENADALLRKIDTALIPTSAHAWIQKRTHTNTLGVWGLSSLLVIVMDLLICCLDNLFFFRIVSSWSFSQHARKRLQSHLL